MLSRLVKLSYAIICIVTAGCVSNNQTSIVIDNAESIALEHPDSALKLMRDIDPSTIRDRHSMAHYRLVYSEVLYYNYSEGNDDSLTLPMAEYYIGSNRHQERSRAMFQHAIIKKNYGDFDKAMYYFLEAKKSLEQTNNPRLEGLVHRAMGEIYGAEYLFSNALNEYLIAKECFEAVGSEYLNSYTNYNIGMTYLCLQDYEQANIYLKEALSYAEENASKELVCEIIGCLLDSYCSQAKYDMIAELYDKYDEYIKHSPVTYYLYRAIHNAYRGNSTQAIADLDEAEEAGCDNMHLEHTSYIVYDILGDDKLALDYLERCVRRQNSRIIVSLDAPILNMQVELGIREKLELQMRRKYEQLIFWLIAIIVIIFISAFTYIKLIRKKAEIELLREQVESTLEGLNIQANRVKSLTALASEKEQMVSRMRRDIANHLSRELGRISDLLDAYYSDVTKSVKHNQVIHELDKYVKDFADSPEGYCAVEHMVNEYLDNIMQKLRTQMVSFKENDYRLLCLIYADFSSNAICMFMGYDKNKLYKHKSKLKAMLTGGKAEDKSLFIKHLR